MAGTSIALTPDGSSTYRDIVIGQSYKLAISSLHPIGQEKVRSSKLNFDDRRDYALPLPFNGEDARCALPAKVLTDRFHGAGGGNCVRRKLSKARSGRTRRRPIRTRAARVTL